MAEVCWLIAQALSGECRTAPPPRVDAGAAIAHFQQDQHAIPPETVSAAVSPHGAPGPRFSRSAECRSGPLSAVRCGGRSPQVNVPRPPATANPGWSLSLPQLTVPRLSSPLPMVATVTTPARSPQFSQPPIPVATARRPTNGAQFYQQRRLALQAGRLYTRLAPESYASQWDAHPQSPTYQPTYQDWLRLLQQEAQALARGQGQNRLEVVVGDSLGLWLPVETLPRDRLWLNQSISGDTTTGILRRLSAFQATRPTVIHVLAGANDLKNGVAPAAVGNTLHWVIKRLKAQHPQARIVVYSVLPTRRADIPNDRIQQVNHRLIHAAQQEGVTYRDLHRTFGDPWGNLRAELTTDGLHLNSHGYALWQQVMFAATLSL